MDTNLTREHRVKNFLKCTKGPPLLVFGVLSGIVAVQNLYYFLQLTNRYFVVTCAMDIFVSVKQKLVSSRFASQQTHKRSMIIAIDFDGTVVEHKYPEVGDDVPYAVETIKELVEQKHQIILWTMRSGDKLQEAVDWYKKHNIPLYGINCNPTQIEWTHSPKAYAQMYIDDAALGTPLANFGGKPFVNWFLIKTMLVERNIIIND